MICQSPTGARRLRNSGPHPSLSSISPHVDVDEPTRGRALSKGTLEIRPTALSALRDGHGKVEGDVPSAATLHEQGFVPGTASALDAEVDAGRRIEQHQSHRNL